MKKLVLVVAAMLFLAGNAYAVVPTIDGLVTSLNEWNGSQLSGGDLNESGISNSWDIQSVFMKVIAGDGWYFRMDTWGAPTFAPGPGGTPFVEAYFQFYMDINADNSADYLVDLNGANYPKLRLVSAYDTSGEIGKAGTSNALSSIVEMYVPNSLLSTNVFFGNAGNPFGIYARLDGSGSEPDDFLPDSGWIKTPEPTSMMLLGFGLMSLVGGVIRRKKFIA